MNNDKDQWIEDILSSMEGSERAVPDGNLFAKITSEIARPEAMVIPIRRFRIAAAAAVILLLLNIFSVSRYAKTMNLEEGATVVMSTSEDQPLISTYQLYDL